MKSDLPKTAAFLEQNSVAHDGLWVQFAEQLERENATLRRMLAWACAGAALYHDDGELQDNREPPFIDFKRDSTEAITAKSQQRAMNYFSRDTSPQAD